MKPSKYNFIFDYDGNKYLFNSLSGGLGVLDKDFTDVDIFGSIDKITPDIKNKLEQGSFLIPPDLNELDYIKGRHYLQRYGNNNSIGITLAPTLACNFRCTYCYESETNYPDDKIMSFEVLEKIEELIDKTLNNNGIATINWFGGEPLLALDIIKRFHNNLTKIKKKKSLNIYSSMVTNGYLLSADVVKELKELGIYSFQVTLDGDEETHDSRRFLADGKGTYASIIDNLANIDPDVGISVRINIDKNNAAKIEKLLNNLVKYGFAGKKNIGINFGQVRVIRRGCEGISDICYSTKDFSFAEVKLYQLIMEKGFMMTYIPRPFYSNCGAISPNSYLIEPGGGIQKCWSAIGDTAKQVGHMLDPDQKKYQPNTYKWLSWDPFGKQECTNCDVLPLCMGGCPYFSIYGEEYFEKNNYSCNALKYNLDEMLKLIVISNKRQTKEWEEPCI